MAPLSQKEFLIVGQGIAGSMLAWHLMKSGHAVTIVDHNHHESSSIISAGIINPITGQRLAVTPQFDLFSKYALKTYSQVSAELKNQFFISKPIIRVLRNTDELKRCQHLNTQPAALPYINEINTPGKLGDSIKDPLGTLSIAQGGYLHVQHLLIALKEYFILRKMLMEERLDYNDLKFTGNTAHWKARSFDGVIFCEGFKTSQNPWFKDLPYSFAKGEILRIAFDSGSLPNALLVQQQWCFPAGDGTHLAGSTYDRININTQCTQEGRTEILKGLSHFIAAKPRVIEHYAGIRPVMLDQKPVFEMHPSVPRLAIFNGLGSKGVLWAPYYAHMLTELLN